MAEKTHNESTPVSDIDVPTVVAEPESLPFLIRPDNVVRYEDGDVLILDRRVYPNNVSFVRCRSTEDVAVAIEDMVTQSEGPGYCAGYGLVQAAQTVAGKSAKQQAEHMATASERLLQTRPTNNHIRLVVEDAARIVADALDRGESLEQALLAHVRADVVRRHSRAETLGLHGARIFSGCEQVLTHCWAENGLIYMLKAARDAGKEVSVICTETRPYLQGARLTADAVADLGLPVHLITDGMAARMMEVGRVSLFTSGADRTTMDGHVVNKVGTQQIAIACREFGIPYYPLCYGPDPHARTVADVPIEERDPESVLTLGGQRLATPKVGAYYPAFDATAPKFVHSYITDRGVYASGQISNYLTTI